MLLEQRTTHIIVFLSYTSIRSFPLPFFRASEERP